MKYWLTIEEIRRRKGARILNRGRPVLWREAFPWGDVQERSVGQVEAKGVFPEKLLF